MKTELIDAGDEQVYAVIFDKGDEVIAGLMDFAKRHGVAASEFTAIGAFSDVMLGYVDRERKDYKKIPVHEQVEVLSLTGNIALDQRAPKIHAHVVIGKSDGTAWGGHVLQAHVWPTLEVIVTESPAYLKRKPDPETGLTLIDLDAARDGRSVK
jgi:predicted DNA-binding protein with PD1-like motif